MRKDELTAMTLEQVIAAVNGMKNKSAFHEVQIMDGAPIVLDSCVLYVTSTMSYKFKMNYYKNKVIRLEKAIYKASNSEEVALCHKIYDALSTAQQSCVSKRAIDVLHTKDVAVKVGEKIIATERDTAPRVHDEKNPFIVHAANGSTLLQLYKSFQYNVHKKAYRVPRKRYFLVASGTEIVTELTESDPKVIKALKAAAKTARTLAGKKDSKPSLVYSIKIGNILTIDGHK